MFALSERTCYHPDCHRPVISWLDDSTPAVDAQIAHIYGAHPGSPRYDPSMSDDQRRAFTNLILLCKPHHDLIDRLRPGDFSAEVLKQWKADREGDQSAPLTALTEDRLEEMLLEVVRQAGPSRSVTVGLEGGFMLDGSAGGVPIAGWRTILDANPSIAGRDRVLVTTVYNVGALRASVESVSIFLGVQIAETTAPATLMGRNDYPSENPRLPRGLESGDQMSWLTALSSIGMMRDGVLGVNPAVGFGEVWSAVRLGSGEQIASDRYSIDLFPLR